MLTHTTNIRVRYAETDQMNAVYYANYFIYFEQGRTELLRTIGLAYTELEKMGYILPVIEAHARYFKSAAYDHPINVITILRSVPTAKIEIEYEVRDSETDQLIATGYTIHGFVKANTRKPTRAPKSFIDLIEKALSLKEN